MSLSALFSTGPTCDIYLIEKKKSNSMYGIPVEDLQETIGYPEKPTYTNVECYFKLKSSKIKQEGPNNKVEEVYEVLFYPEQDIKVNAKIVWQGREFIAQIPQNKFDKFIRVEAVRVDSL